MPRPQLAMLLNQQRLDLLLYGFCRWIQCHLLCCIIRCRWSGKCADQDRCAIQIVETMLNNPGMDVPTEARMICLFRHYNHPIGFFDSCSDGLFVEWD